MSRRSFRGFLQMAAEPVAHGREQLALEIRRAAGSESRIERRGEHRHTFLRAPEIMDVLGIAAVNHDVAGRQQRQQIDSDVSFFICESI